eukprot:3190783-Pleurochrysis_carterae.AAC.3
MRASSMCSGCGHAASRASSSARSPSAARRIAYGRRSKSPSRNRPAGAARAASSRGNSPTAAHASSASRHGSTSDWRSACIAPCAVECERGAEHLRRIRH